VRGRQLPDVPYWISTVGSNLRFLDFIFTPIVHIVSSRSGDTTGLQPVAGYATLDLNFGYERNFDFGTLNASLAVMNVFDTAYIGQISNGYYQQTSSSGIYFPGAPRTVMAKVGYRF
jgi:iron complex outermembrane receptor protein